MSNYHISFVTESWFEIGGFLLIKAREHGQYLIKYVLNDHKLAEILFKVALNTITLTLFIIFKG